MYTTMYTDKGVRIISHRAIMSTGKHGNAGTETGRERETEPKRERKRGPGNNGEPEPISWPCDSLRFSIFERRLYGIRKTPRHANHGSLIVHAQYKAV